LSEPPDPPDPSEPPDPTDPGENAGTDLPQQPGFGLPDLGGLLEGMQRIQEAQAAPFAGRAGGGAVQIEATGSLEFTAVTISAEALSTGDVELVQDLVLAALHDLTERVAAAHREAVGAIGDLGDLGLGHLGLGDLATEARAGLAGLGPDQDGGPPIDVAAREDPPGH